MPRSQTMPLPPIEQLLPCNNLLAAAVDRTLCEAIPIGSGSPARLAEAMRYAVVSGGKHFRAMLTVAVADLVGGSHAGAVRVAAAIECVHAQSLVHDDLPCMDDDDLRRGRPSLHRAFDEATAVLAGDALLALAFEILGDEATHPDCGVRIRLVSALARALGTQGLAGGQMMDLYPSSPPNADQVSRCASLKTGALIRFAVEAGAMLGECKPDVLATLVQFAENLGRVFQIRDDILDRIGDERIVGKAVGKDEAKGRPTTVSLFGLDGTRNEAFKLARQCEDALDAFGQDAGMLRDITRLAANRLN